MPITILTWLDLQKASPLMKVLQYLQNCKLFPFYAVFHFAILTDRRKF